MAGEMYEVFGQMKWGPGVACPASLVGKRVQLQSKEGDIFELPAEAAALSLRMRSDMLGNSDKFEYPIKKEVLSKVIDYLKHHKEHAASEIRTPLQFDNLQDCGATRWDSSYANVDKEMLFDLTVAASYLDIPSLFFLLSAKAALMTGNKSADKLRKEFGMANDLPAGEEAELRREYGASRRSQGAAPDTDLSQLAAQSVIRNGMKAAEQKAGIKALANADDGDASALTFKSWRHAMWRAAALEDWKLLANAPEQVKGDRDLLKGLIWSSQGEALKYASPELRADEALVLEATKHFGSAFANAAPELKTSREFVLKAVATHGAALAAAPDSFRNDKSFLVEAAKLGAGSALQGSSSSFRADRNLILEMVDHDPQSYMFASEDLLNDKNFALAVAKRNGKALKYMLPNFRADPDIVRAAVSRDPGAAQFAHASRRAELGMIDQAVHGEQQMSEELQRQLKAAQEEASSTTALAVSAGGPIQVPLQADQTHQQFTCMKLQKTVHFTAFSTMMANMGQANYVAANSYLDKIPSFERPEIDAVGLMWGAVGGIGMRFKAFASADILNDTPDALLTIPDAMKVVHMAACKIDPPEWFAANHFDEFIRQQFLQPSAGKIKLEPQQAEAAKAAEAQWDQMVDADREALKDLAVVDRRPLPGNFSEPGAPLGGWPSLMKAGADVPLVEGTKIRLTGLRAKNGTTGTLLQQFPDGKWKVRLDDGSGNALLRPSNFEAVVTGSSAGGARKPRMHMEDSAELRAHNAMAAEERRSNIEERRRLLKEKIASRRQVASAVPGTSAKREQQFFIAGSWAGSELQQMNLCPTGQYYACAMTMGATGQESFQVLLDRSWNACLHAGDTPEALLGGVKVQGPDPKWRCEGMNFMISDAVPGTRYEVRLFLNSRGNAQRVEWAKADGIFGSENKLSNGSASLRVDVSTTPPASVAEDSGPASASDGEAKISSE
eukprot:TRINITY_DN21150_c0_g1_i1.p1 TRINITY_DN21150_c0_g1~~TRINITY_DN21150_c0_g1_i1.p1  ORF type:complete len:955 (-),score=246.14 TRINITY_DN21150_c0_g1_i1:133-2997(-)